LGEGQTILVVEDNMDVRRALTTSLEGMNYRVLEATNGKKALEIFEQQSHQIALVLTDLVMPEMGGQALIGALRQRAPDVKAVVVTGHSLNDHGEDLEVAGVNARLQKPVDLDELAAVIARVLRDG
jgi:CheY-like chemotaxis protein